MVVIDGQGDLVGIEGTVDELAENTAALYATVLQHVIEEGEERGSRDAAIVVIEALTEAMLRTVMDLIEDEEGVESILSACRTIAETGVIDKSAYKIFGREGAIS